jgi:hypothetical protein
MPPVQKTELKNMPLERQPADLASSLDAIDLTAFGNMPFVIKPFNDIKKKPHKILEKMERSGTDKDLPVTDNGDTDFRENLHKPTQWSASFRFTTVSYRTFGPLWCSAHGPSLPSGDAFDENGLPLSFQRCLNQCIPLIFWYRQS